MDKNSISDPVNDNTTNSLKESNTSVAGQKNITRMKEKLNFHQFLDNDSDSSDTSSTNLNSTKSDKVPTTSATTYKEKVTNENKNSSTLEKQVIGTNSELQNSVRQIQRDQIRTELIQNLVIRTQGGDSISTNNKSSSEHNSINVPKIPTLPDFKSRESSESGDDDANDPNYSVVDTNIMVSTTDNGSMCSGITDNFSQFARTNGIITDSILDFLISLST